MIKTITKVTYEVDGAVFSTKEAAQLFFSWSPLEVSVDEWLEENYPNCSYPAEPWGFKKRMVYDHMLPLVSLLGLDIKTLLVSLSDDVGKD